MELDLAILGGSVVDGSAAARATPSDVGVKDGRIAAVTRPGELAGAVAARTLDATGRVVAPGFIDPHTHAEIAVLGGEDRYAGILQGVTTYMTWADGFGWAPLPSEAARELWRSTLFAYGASPDAALDFEWPRAADYLSIFPGRTPVNIVPMVPHLAVRFGAMGWTPRTATPEELARMRAATREWMEAGAVGLNTGLDYQPSIWSDTDELVELARVVAEYGGVYASHQRYIVAGELGGYRETIEIGRRTGIPVMVSHAYPSDEIEALLEEAAGGSDVAFESYLYPAGSTHLIYGVPAADAVGGPEAIRDRLDEPAFRERVVGALVADFERSRATGARAYFAGSRTGRFIGQTVGDIAAERRMTLPAVMEMLLREELPDAVLVYHRGFTDEQWAPTVRRTISHPRMLVASDAVGWGSRPHPRGWGCFSRIVRLCVRELRAVTLEQAVHKMSGYTAERYCLRDRGLVRPGLAADLVVFDADTIADGATWEEPRARPVGIDAVVVNGVVAAEHGRPTEALAGAVLRPLVG